MGGLGTAGGIRNKFSGIKQVMGMKKILIAIDDGHGKETAGKRTPAFSDGKKRLRRADGCPGGYGYTAENKGAASQ